jgi:GNAT superfamily N-acetyltransferase
MPDGLVIRPATINDHATVVEFNRLLAEESEGKRLDLELLGPGVRAALADPTKARYYLACRQENPVGQVMLTFEWSDWRNGEIWWIQSVYVRPDHRRQGVYRALHEHVSQLAMDTPGVVGLRLYVDERNLRAQQTYRRLGLRPAGYFVMENLTVPIETMSAPIQRADVAKGERDRP